MRKQENKAATDTKQIKIHIGACSSSISVQLRRQGIKVTRQDVTHFQRAHDGFVQLQILGCFGDKEAERIRQRLFNKIVHFCKQKRSQLTEIQNHNP